MSGFQVALVLVGTLKVSFNVPGGRGIVTGFFWGDAVINSDRGDATIVTGFCSPTFRINCLKNAFGFVACWFND